MARDLKLDKQLVYAFGVTVRCAKEIFVVATNLEWLPIILTFLSRVERLKFFG